MVSAIEDIIERLEDYIDECKPAAFSSSKIIVNRDEIEVLLNDLKTKTPEEIRQYQKIISNKESIIANARKQADDIVQQAQVQTTELVSEHQIMQQAYAQANEVVMIATKEAQETLNQATLDANDIRQAAITYTDELLQSLQQIIMKSMDTTRRNMESYLKTMQGYLDIVVANRMELSPNPEAVAASTVVPETAVTNEETSTGEKEASVTQQVTNDLRAERVDETADAFVDTVSDGSGSIDIPDSFFRKE